MYIFIKCIKNISKACGADKLNSYNIDMLYKFLSYNVIGSTCIALKIYQ